MKSIPVLLLILLPTASFAQGKLDAVRESVDSGRASDRDRSSGSSSDDSSSGSNEPCPSSGGGSFFDWPYVGGRFSVYPYATPGTSYLLPEEKREGQGFSFRTSLEFGSDFDGLSRLGFRFAMDTESRFGLKTDWDYYHERLPFGRRDETWLGDVTGTYRIFQETNGQVYLGIGARFLADRWQDAAGVNFLAGADLFLSKPVHLFGTAEVGTLGDAGVERYRGGLGWHVGPAEFFGGYDYFRIGRAKLQGPFLGVRIWY